MGLPLSVRTAVLRVVDSVAPLHEHVVICGMPRSGTTLLHLMLQVSVTNARTFPRETRAVRLARSLRARGYPRLISKRPDDVLEIDLIRAAYARMRTTPRFLVCTRDPRAVLTSRHARRGSGYYVALERWRALDAAIEQVRHDEDVMIVEFRDLVLAPDDTQAALAHRLGWEMLGRFSDAHTRIVSGFDTAPLNGLRPPDPSTLTKWQDPEHHDQLRAIVRGCPELPERVRQLGYAADDAWLRHLSAEPVNPPSGGNTIRIPSAS